MLAIFKGKQFRYDFEILPVKGTLNNKKLGIDGSSISINMTLDSIKRDMIMLLLYGGSALNAVGADLEKCEISHLLGNDPALDKYIKQKYILVSRITSGATSNSQGQLAQTVVYDFLVKYLGENYKVIRNGTVRLDGYSKSSGMPFDVVVEKGCKYIGIEVSFQVTTNSVIET